MKIHPALIACANCDTLSRSRPLARGERLICASCGAVLLRSGLGIQQLLALSLSAGIVFIIANVFPVLEINLNGRHIQTTLLGSVLSLADFSSAPIAIIVALALIVAPALQIALLCWLLLYARAGKRAPYFNSLLRVWTRLHPWSMVEVGLLAALVAVVKLQGLLHVQVGIGIWAIAALAVLLTVLTHRNVRALWAELEQVRS